MIMLMRGKIFEYNFSALSFKAYFCNITKFTRNTVD